MPYASNAELPKPVRDALPAAAQSVFRNVVNSQEERGLSTERAFRSAWAALKAQGWVKNEDTGKWHKVEKIAWHKLEQVQKVDSERQYVFGWASVAIAKDGTQVEDLQGDLIDVEDLEDAAYQFALDYRGTGVMHQGEVVGQLIESFMVTPEKLDALGLPPDALPQGLWVGFHVPDAEVFAKVKAGEFRMFSIQGDAIREEAA
jgi:cation transport regulator ChaB